MGGPKNGQRDGKTSKSKKTHGQLSDHSNGIYQSWPCIFCGEECTENEEQKLGYDSINCFGCKKWAHQRCAKLSNTEFMDMVRSRNKQWVCTPCVEADNPPVSERDARLDKLLDIIPVIKTMNNRMGDLEKHVQELSGPKLDKKIEDIVDRKVKEAMEEQCEIDRRKKNLIVVNLKECFKPNEKDRIASDTRAIKHLLAQIVDLDDDEMTEPVRLGAPPKKGDKPRLVKFSVKTEEKKSEIIRKARSLNDYKPYEKRVYFNSDYTPKQREWYKQLKEEVKKRTEAGEKNLGIRNYKVVVKKSREFRPVIQNADSSNEESDEESDDENSDENDDDKELIDAAERLDPSSKSGAVGGRR